jgi:hypothetical protein
VPVTTHQTRLVRALNCGDAAATVKGVRPR